MLYVITEDSSSGYLFWENLGNLFPEGTYEVRTACGVGNVIKVLRLLLKELEVEERKEKKDIIFLAIDNVSFGSRAFDSVRVLNSYIASINNKCCQNGISLYTSDFYCYEEVLLSFRPLHTLIGDKDRLLELYSTISDCLYAKEDYTVLFDIIKEIDEQLSNNLLAAGTNNREHMSAELLKYLTHGTNFFTSKNKLGKCFTSDCCSNTIEKISKECKVFNHSDKLVDKCTSLINNTILVKDFKRMLELENIEIPIKQNKKVKGFGI